VLQDKRFAYGLLLVLFVAFPFILTTDFLRSLLVLGVIFAMLTLSLDIIVSGMGQFSFGHQAFFAIGAYTTTFLSVKLGVTPFVGFLAAFAFTGLVGLLVGYIALRAVRGVYLAIVTLGFTMILSRLVRYFREFTRGTWGSLLCLSGSLLATRLTFSSLEQFCLYLSFLCRGVYIPPYGHLGRISPIGS